MPDAKAWWNRAGQEDARWYIATTSDPFFERGRRDTDELVAFCGLQPSRDKTLLEAGAPQVRRPGVMPGRSTSPGTSAAVAPTARPRRG
jgi:hypothetical protein